VLTRDAIAHRKSRIPLAALGAGIVGVAAWMTARTAPPPAAPPAPARPLRVAIRVACDVAPGPRACDLAEALAVDVWSEQRGPGLPLDVVVPSDRLPALAAAGVSWRILVADIDAEAAAEAARLRSPAAHAGDWFADYRDYGAIREHLDELVQLDPARVSLQAIGNSLENRPIWAIEISGAAAASEPAPVPMLITSTQHAREWLAAMTTTCVADRLVRGYATDPVIRAFVDSTRLWIVPVVNPDGYQYTWSTDRYWRKNRRERHGVDLNRNYSVGFGGTGSSGDQRSETYRGPRPFSEPESAAVRDLALRNGIALHIDFHTYGQIVLYPWGYTRTPPPDRDRLAAVGDRMTSAIVATHGTRYRLSSAVEFYPAAGDMPDWMYGEAGALSYTIELRPEWPAGRGGFVQPPSQIAPTCDEGLAGVLALRSADRKTLD
jgi:zinc carboxypeptidase